MKGILRSFCVLLWLLPAAVSQAADFPAAAFPLRISADGSYLEDSRGRPFLIHGDAAWSLISQLGREDALAYLADRKRRGFNALLVSLIEHKYASHAPANAYGDPPFLGSKAFAQPNDRYFDHADWVLRQAGAMGFLVILAPAYLGFNGGDEGWYAPMKAAGVDALSSYGSYVGRRFGALKNILWLYAGDYDPPDKDLVRALVKGVQSSGAAVLGSAHGAPDTIVSDFWKGETWLDIDTVYTYGDPHRQVLERYRRGAGKPILMLETKYENEQGADEAFLRQAAYGALLAGAAGQIFGNNPVWYFSGPGPYGNGTPWREALSSRGAQSMTHLRRLWETLPWWRLRPGSDPNLLKASGGQAAMFWAASADRSAVVAYLANADAVEIDGTGMPRGTRYEWFDPATGSRTRPEPLAPKRLGLAPPSPRNGAGFADWVLVVRSQD